jgi:bla regulator protein BlaR1
MLSWMLYALCTSSVICVAALAAEYRSRLVRGRRRWIWIVALLVSVTLPMVMSSISVRVPSLSGSENQTTKVVALREMTSLKLSPADLVGSNSTSPSWHIADSAVRGMWITLSTLLLGALAGSGALLYWRKRRWHRGVVASASVLVADDAGPAVIGLFRPVIVVPRWLTDAPNALQQSVIAHERSHLDAHDPHVLTLALCLLVIMPWNLPLWWQVGRLRRAIEVDCDSRVISGGLDVASYAETLIAVGERRAEYIGVAAGMSESRAFLEERIKIMLSERKSWPWLAATLGGVTLAMLAAAADISPPETNGATHSHQWIELSAAQLDKYVGDYAVSENQVVAIERQNGQLSAKGTGYQGSSPIYPETSIDFFFGKEADSNGFTFVLDAAGNVVSMVLHQPAADLDQPASRIESSKAKQIGERVAAKVQSQSPTPGSAEAVKRVVNSTMADNPNFAEMTAPLAASLRKYMPPLKEAYKGLGDVQSITFRGVTQQGADIYLVVFEKGVMQYCISVFDGVITGLTIHTAE